MKTQVIAYDFSQLNSPENAEKFEQLIEKETTGKDIGILVNIVGMVYFGRAGQASYKNIFDCLNTNCSS